MLGTRQPYNANHKADLTHLPMPLEHDGLTEGDVMAKGGWHPRYARVLATTSEGDDGFAAVDGNGDGAELDTEVWMWGGQTWSEGVF